MKYDTLITGWGECALEFLNEDCNFLIIFNDTAPQELADISVLHTAAEITKEPAVGDTLYLCDIKYTITAIGSEFQAVRSLFSASCISAVHAGNSLHLFFIEKIH